MAELNLNDTNIPPKNVTPNIKPVVTSASLQSIQQGGTVNLNSHVGTNIAFQSHGVANNAPNSIQLQNPASGTSLNLQTNPMMPLHPVMPQMMPNNIGNPGMNIPPMQHSNSMGAYPKSSRGRGSSMPYLAQNNNMVCVLLTKTTNFEYLTKYN